MHNLQHLEPRDWPILVMVCMLVAVSAYPLISLAMGR